MCSFGDAAAVSEVVDPSLAQVLKHEVSDLIIAPGFHPAALEMLKSKKQGGYIVIRIDPDYEPPEMESRELFGFRLQQKRNSARISRELFRNAVTSGASIPDSVIETLIVATIALKYTQSNSVCVAYDGQVIGMGAGQQSRVLSEPEERGMLSGLAQVLERITREERSAWIEQFEGICLSSDAYIPFRDNIDRAGRSNVRFVAHAGGSTRDAEVTEAAEQYRMTLVQTGLRLFLH